MSEERTEFIDYLKGKTVRVKYTTEDRVDIGGYLLPEYVDVPRYGLIPWIWRALGEHFNRQDWYDRGMKPAPFAKAIIETLEMAKERQERRSA